MPLPPSMPRSSPPRLSTVSATWSRLLAVVGLLATAVGSSASAEPRSLVEGVSGAVPVSVDVFKPRNGMIPFGLVTIPVEPLDSAGSCDYSHICLLEYEGKYEEAFAAYERLMMVCGDGKWHTFAHLGRGETASVMLRKTPCGSFVAMKIPNTEGLIPTVARTVIKHIGADCDALRRLAPYLNQPECNGCFPRYYHYSNITGVCYNEYVESIPMGKFISAFDADTPRGLDVVKTAMLQSLDALAILKANDIVHRDLLFKNMLARLLPGRTPSFQVVIMDFCWATRAVKQKLTQTPIGHYTRAHDWCVCVCECRVRVSRVKASLCLWSARL